MFEHGGWDETPQPRQLCKSPLWAKTPPAARVVLLAVSGDLKCALIF